MDIDRPYFFYTRITYPNRGETLSAIRISTDRKVFVYSGKASRLEVEGDWRMLSYLTERGSQELIHFLENDFAKLPSIPMKKDGYVHYKIQTQNCKYELYGNNTSYDKLPSEFRRLEIIVNGNLSKK